MNKIRLDEDAFLAIMKKPVWKVRNKKAGKPRGTNSVEVGAANTKIAIASVKKYGWCTAANIAKAVGCCVVSARGIANKQVIAGVFVFEKRASVGVGKTVKYYHIAAGQS